MFEIKDVLLKLFAVSFKDIKENTVVKVSDDSNALESMLIKAFIQDGYLCYDYDGELRCTRGGERVGSLYSDD